MSDYGNTNVNKSTTIHNMANEVTVGVVRHDPESTPSIPSESPLLLLHCNMNVGNPNYIHHNINHDNDENKIHSDSNNHNQNDRLPLPLKFGWIDHQLDYLRDHPLHPITETIVAWMVAILCLIYYGYQYISLYVRQRHHPTQQQQQQKRIPLMTEANVQNQKCIDPIRQVQDLYSQITNSLFESIIHPKATINHNQSNKKNGVTVAMSDLALFLLNASRSNDYDCTAGNTTTTTTTTTSMKAAVIQFIRINATLRRQVSQYTMIMTSLQQPPTSTTSTKRVQTSEYTTATTTNPTTGSTTTTPGITLEMKQLYLFFDSIWTDLLRLPSVASSRNTTTATTTSNYVYTITVVIPIYNECGTSVIHTTLRVALQHCDHPSTVQIILVDAGRCQNLHIIHDYIQQQQQSSHKDNVNKKDRLNGSKLQYGWGEVKYVKFHSGGGRGPCQNYGAQFALGRYMTFLHSDTLLPSHWDTKVRTTLDRTSHNGTVVTHACSFSVGHNVSNEGLGSWRYPYGIRSILLLGNIRAWLFRLPYGDHILSFHTEHFRYIGGFPHQPIMEDYAIMDLLRQRAAVVPHVETLRIIPPPTGLCSVRRWQMYGVVYVTLVNALIVHRYAYGGWTADDVFSYYYLHPQKQKTQ